MLSSGKPNAVHRALGEVSRLYTVGQLRYEAGINYCLFCSTNVLIHQDVSESEKYIASTL